MDFTHRLRLVDGVFLVILKVMGPRNNPCQFPTGFEPSQHPPLPALISTALLRVSVRRHECR